jgi:ABC-type multidrug transport system ATPase subunit
MDNGQIFGLLGPNGAGKTTEFMEIKDKTNETVSTLSRG